MEQKVTGFIVACKQFFGFKDGQTLLEFKTEVNALTPQDRLDMMLAMTDKFKGRYLVGDIYAGQAQVEYFTFCAGDLEDDMTDGDLEREYELAMQDHFEQHIRPESDLVPEFIAWAREQLVRRAKEQS